MQPQAPDAFVRGVLRVMDVAAVWTRNMAKDEGTSREQIYDLWEAVHPLPSLVTHWSKGSEAFLLICLRGYDEKWGSPDLRGIYGQARDAPGSVP